VSIAGLQARYGLDAGLWTERDMAEVAARCRGGTADELLQRPYFADPLRKHDCAPITDGAAVVILARDDRARDLTERPARIVSIQHRVETPHLGARDLTTSPSTVAAAKAAGADGITLAELHTPFSHQEILLRQALGLGDEVEVNPSGGPLAGNPMFAAGLARIGEAATRIRPGERALAHATSGPALQQNLVCVLEAD
jgi:acetyl-CoA acetyltransferase